MMMMTMTTTTTTTFSNQQQEEQQQQKEEQQRTDDELSEFDSDFSVHISRLTALTNLANRFLFSTAYSLFYLLVIVLNVILIAWVSELAIHHGSRVHNALCVVPTKRHFAD